MISDRSYSDVVRLRKHLIALGEQRVFLYSEEGFPFHKVQRVEAGSTYRLNGPSSCRLFVEEYGLEISLSVDFEPPSANGKGTSLFDRDRLRDLMVKLPPEGRASFAKLLRGEVLNGLASRTNELRDALRFQADSEDCVRGLIAFAEQESGA